MAVAGELTVTVRLDAEESADALAIVEAFKRLHELLEAHRVPVSASDRATIYAGAVALKRSVRIV
jgi:hypothetical protein